MGRWMTPIEARVRDTIVDTIIPDRNDLDSHNILIHIN